MSAEQDIKRGLVGVVADTTSISMVNEETNSLLYRGYPVQDLSARCSFEQVAYLIWKGELPTDQQLKDFEDRERSLRRVDETVLSALSGLSTKCHPMDILRTAVSLIGAGDPNEDDISPSSNLDKSMALMAKLPTIVASEQRRHRGQSRIDPDPSLSFSENFFHMCFGSVPEPEVVRCLEISLILYAEHSFNASTFTARVIASTLSDVYSAVTGAIGALKGPLHGGANEAVMEMLQEIDDPARAADWLRNRLESRAVVMGFGHRVYKHGDSRVPTMQKALRTLASQRQADRLMELYENLERAVLETKGIHPNLDYPTGPSYHLMGFDTPTFTPIFVMSRITGWTAHIMEQLSANSLIRPLSCYVGAPERSLA